MSKTLPNPAPNSTANLSAAVPATIYPILFAISIVHLLNDSMQSSISALFPILHDSLNLNFAQIGIIALCMNLTASVLQPMIGLYADKHPKPYILPIGVCFTLIGIIALAIAPNYASVLLAVACVGVGSSIFHPESSRVAYMAAGQKRGLAQSIFQVGGNIGSSLGPLMTAFIFLPLGQFGVIWFTIAAGTAIIIQFFVAGWYSRQNLLARRSTKPKAAVKANLLTRRQVGFALTILILLVFSKNVYMASITSFYNFFLVGNVGVTVKHAQLFIFAFLAAAAAGTFIGGPLSDRFGRRKIIWFSILGTAPFSILLPYANIFWSGVLCVCAGFVLSSAFSIIVVYAQELLPGKVGLVSGLFFGLAFGLGGLGSAVLGFIADETSIAFIMKICSYLPLIGLLTVFLPKDEALRGQ
ncbi:MFS transporter [Paenibacillus psychroresistens]|uniref:MFS transporter n=1 Tax=Paenibacillus psychroresistens TaxID=1778678 RepID=A0A6B8RJB9_9BACL|nr:MFS transporter [Paenibacillus psychroresistens]QGQ96360.1 MFS transporter [Paenibacillus psychroresistens]